MVEEEDGVPTDPVGCNSEAKSVEGVDGQDSVRSSIGPPASSSKRSNQKGMGRSHRCQRWMMFPLTLKVVVLKRSL